MKDIKTKEIKKDIKTLDKTRVIAELKNAAAHTKVKLDQKVAENENSPNEYAFDRTEQVFIHVKDETFYKLNKQGQKGLKKTQKNISKARDYFRNRKNNGYINSEPKSSSGAKSTENQVSKLLKQPSSSAGRMTAKTAEKHTIKTTQKSVKTAEKTSKATIKTTQQSAKAVQKTAQAAAKASQKATQAARAAAKATVATLKAATKTTVAAVKAIIAGTKALVAAIAAGGWVAVVIIMVICLIALIVGSCFGIFFAGKDTGSNITLQQVVREINEDYQNQLKTIKVNNPHDDLVITGTLATWPKVLSVYAVKTATDPDNPQEVATITEGKKQILTDIFWEMNEIEYHITTHTETESKESYDDEGNVTEDVVEVTKNILYITITQKTVDEMALKYSLNADQVKLLKELLVDDNDRLWETLNMPEIYNSTY